MPNKIQIKRSTTNAAPVGLANGELAYTSNGEILFLGHPDGTTGSIAIGGKRTPGTLTANQALVANSTLGIDKVIVANLVPTQIYANGSVGSAGYVLVSGAAGNVHWVEPTAGVAGSNSQVQFNANGSLAGDDGFTYDGVSNTLTVQNISVSGTATLNIDSISVGNSTVNTSLVPTLIQAANSTGTANLTPTGLRILDTIANTTGLFVGANVFANSSAVDVGNTIIASTLLTLGGQVNANGGVGTAGQVLTSGAAGNAYWTTLAASVAGSNSQIQFNANGVLSADAGFTIDGVTDTVTLGGAAQTTAPRLTVSNTTTSANLTSATLTIGTSVVNATAVASGANVYLTTTALLIGNSTVNSTASATLLQVSNSTSTSNLTATQLNIGANVFANTSAFDVGNTIITTTNLTLGGQVTANGSAGTANQVFVSSGAANAYWTSSLSLTDITLSGNLTINGTLTTVDTTNLVVKDPLIKLANGNVTTDTLDIGFFGVYDSSGTQDRFAGIFRDATDGVFKLFANTVEEPTTTVNTTSTGYTTGTLQSFLSTGNTTFGTTSPFAVANSTVVNINSNRLIANSSVVNITANATVSVALTANTLSLSTALPATSGGTGQSAYAIGDLLIGGAGNTLSKLTVGADGKVLQSNGTSVVYADLDGGTF